MERNIGTQCAKQGEKCGLARATKNSLPTKQILVTGKVLNDACCDQCKLLLEDTLHALFSLLEIGRSLGLSTGLEPTKFAADDELR